MSMELPCITSPQVITAIGGINEIIFGADHPQKFQVLIEELLRDELQLAQVGKKARAHLVQHFDWASCCKPLDKLETK
jgi:glycosyltransferase involved in cell wall biosynthesis